MKTIMISKLFSRLGTGTSAFLVLLFIAGCSSASQVARPAQMNSPAVPVTTAEEMEKFFDALIGNKLEQYHVPGAVVVVVKDGKVFFQKGYGYADRAQKIAVSPDKTLFRIGSISKTFTWTAVMQLYEQGKLDLDANVNTYLDFKIPDTFPQPITLKHLMTHTPGFEDDSYDNNTIRAEAMISTGEWLKTHLPTRVRPPGQVVAYSNYGAALAGYIVERVSQTRYEDYIARNIFSPLGMTHSTALQPVPSALAPDLAIDYVFSNGNYTPQPFTFVRVAPAGAISATGADMARWMLAHLQDGQSDQARILETATAQKMRRLLFTHDQHFGNSGWLYGFWSYERNGKSIFGHDGWILPALRSDMELFADEKLGLFIAFNGDTTGRAIGETPTEFIDHYFPAGQRPSPVASPTLNDAARVTGAYHMTRASYSTAEKIRWLVDETPWELSALADGKLAASYGSQRATYVQVEPLVFGRVESESKLPPLIVLRADERGEIRYLFLSGTAARERFGWYEDPTLHLFLLGAGYALLISALIAAIVSALWRRRRAALSAPRLARFARAIALVIALLALATVLLLVAVFSNRYAFAYGEGTLVLVALTCSTLVVILTPVALVAAALAWRNQFWGLAARVHFTLVALGSVGLSFSFIIWNLVGWRL